VLELQIFESHAKDHEYKIEYYEYQFEEDQTHGLHLQGLLSWKNRTVPGKTQNFFSEYPRSAWGSLLDKEQIIKMKNYCRKKSSRYEPEKRVIFGKEPLSQVEINQNKKTEKVSKEKEILDLMHSVGLSKAQLEWRKRGGSYKVYNKVEKQYNFNKYCDKKQTQIEKAKAIIWKEWQQTVINYLKAPIHPREILVVIDRNGNSGKSFLMKNFKIINEETTCNLTNGKTRDLMHIISKKPQVENILVNLPRSGHKNINYTALEQAKDGDFCTTKYDGKEVDGDPCRMVIFTNESLDWKKMSQDRWSIMTIKAGGDFKIDSYSEYIRKESTQDYFYPSLF
jgi:hypothetical protein